MFIKSFSRNKTIISKQNKQGFTIVEVTLVMGFIAMLLIVIATILANMISLYQKGMTLKTINSTGRNLIAEFTASINAAPSIDTESLCSSLLREDQVSTCVTDHASNFIFQSLEGQYTDNVTDGGSSQPAQGRVQYGGVFCTGNYSYVWNTKYGREDFSGSNHALTIVYKDGDDNSQSISNFKLARFKDKTYRACSTNVNQDDYNNLSNLENRIINIEEYANGGDLKISDMEDNFLEMSVDVNTENDAETNLDLYELVIFPLSQDIVTLRAFFSGTFILGTERGNASIVRSGDYCDVTNAGGEGSGNLQDLGSEFNYCGINKFNFAARTAGSGV